MPTGNDFQTSRAESQKAQYQKIDCDGGSNADENWMSDFT